MFTRLLMLVMVSYLIGAYYQLTSTISYLDLDKNPSRKSQWIPRLLFLLVIIMYFTGNSKGLIFDKEGFISVMMLLIGIAFIVNELIVFILKYVKTHAPKNNNNKNDNSKSELDEIGQVI